MTKGGRYSECEVSASLGGRGETVSPAEGTEVTRGHMQASLLHKGRDDAKLVEKTCVMLVHGGRRSLSPVSVDSQQMQRSPQWANVMCSSLFITQEAKLDFNQIHSN